MVPLEKNEPIGAKGNEKICKSFRNCSHEIKNSKNCIIYK